jgi:hypothetical protein
LSKLLCTIRVDPREIGDRVNAMDTEELRYEWPHALAGK